MDRRTFLLGGVAGACGLLAGCDKLVGEKYRYRLTAEIQTPEGVRKGSSVFEVESWEGIPFPGPEAGGFRTRFRGEAVAVDLPHGQTLFLLLDQIPNILLEAYGPYLSKAHESFDRIREAKRLRVEAKVPRKSTQTTMTSRGWVANDLYPRFIRFRDIRSPQSAERVDPDNLAQSFGPGVKLVRLTAQITTDDITTGIQRRLPWLPQYRGKTFAGNKYAKSTTSFLDNLSLSSFSSEISR